jgi:hypothetical protein
VCFRFLTLGRVLDLRRAGTRSVCQKCNRCSDAFCSSGICGREHGRAPSVSNFTIYANHMLLVECNFKVNAFAFMATICWALLRRTDNGHTVHMSHNIQRDLGAGN